MHHRFFNARIAGPVLSLLISGLLPACVAEAGTNAAWAAEFYCHYRASTDLTYKIAAGKELKLDVYQRTDLAGPAPTVFYVHSGGWEHSSRSAELGSILPWLEMGWAVVTVDYRLSGAAPAPAAVDDCRCALRWVASHAKDYQLDLRRLVISGASAGGELALVAGMAPIDAMLDQDGGTAPLPEPAAFVNLSGVTDVSDLVQGPHRTPFAVAWVPDGPRQKEIARKVSPLTYVRPGLPPILSVHGDADDTVPYEQAVRFHAALTQAGVPNQLYTIPGGKHGGYPPQQYDRIYEVVRAFLATHHLQLTEPSPDKTNLKQ